MVSAGAQNSHVNQMEERGHAEARNLQCRSRKRKLELSRVNNSARAQKSHVKPKGQIDVEPGIHM